MLLFIGICLAGGLGAVCRYGCDRIYSLFLPAGFPIALVNISACAIAGIVTGLYSGATNPGAVAFSTILVGGFLGGFSTFSTAVVDVLKRFEKGQYGLGLALLIGTWLLSVLAFMLGWMATVS